MSLLLVVCAYVALLTLSASIALSSPNFTDAQLNGGDIKKIGVKITSPLADQIVPVGPLTLYGTSSYPTGTNCQVYVDWNDTKPMQNVTSVANAGPSEYSNWTYTYSQNYHLIAEGPNDLTSKISCRDSTGAGNVTTKYYSINVTGTTNPTAYSIPAGSGNESSSNYTTGIQSVGYHPVLPQYSDTYKNNTSNVDTNGENTAQTAKYVAAINDQPDNFDSSSPSSSSQSSLSSSGDKPYDHQYNTVSISHSVDKGEIKKTNDDKKASEKVKLPTVKHVKKIKDWSQKFKIKQYNGGHSGELSTYIHDLIRAKLNKISQRLLD